MNPPKLGDPQKVLKVVLGCKPEDVAARVVLTPFLPLKAFHRHMEEDGVVDLLPPFFFQGLTGTYKGERVTVIRTGVGPSRVGDCLSILSLTPAKTVVFAGAVGALHPDWAIGEWFLPLDAADGEGYTRYARRAFGEVVRDAAVVSCRMGLEAKLSAYLEGRGEKAREGRVFTIGSIAFESPENLELLARAGFDALEMELSAFYAAAQYHELDAAALTYVSDLPLESSLWQEKTAAEEEALRKAFRKLPEYCLDFIAREG